MMVAKGMDVEISESKAIGESANFDSERGSIPSGHLLASYLDIQRNSIIEHLLQPGCKAQELDKDIGSIYADPVLLSLAAKFLDDAEGRGSPRGASAQKAPLAAWRLKRTVEYINENYTRTITLGDLSAVAGLSRMHFAAQFRRATGCRPREFVLRRRIEAAEEMLVETRASLVEIALNVGFQTQAHFSTVFKRFTGETPNRWRSARLHAWSVDSNSSPKRSGGGRIRSCVL